MQSPAVLAARACRSEPSDATASRRDDASRGRAAKRPRKAVPAEVARKRAARRAVLRTALDYRALGETAEDKWAALLAEDFAMTLPVTPYRSYDGRCVRGSATGEEVENRVVLRGVRGMVFDVASFAVLLQSVGVRGRRGHATVRCAIEVGGDHWDGDAGADSCMGVWSLRTTNARDVGAGAEVATRGMLRAAFAADHRLARLELSFDVLAFMRELSAARRSPVLEVVPNTLAAAERVLDADDAVWDAGCGDGGGTPPPGARPRIITVATRPHVITRANKAFAALCGYAAEEVVGRTLRVLQGPATDAAVVGGLLDHVRARRPASMVVVNYRKDGSRFANYLRVFPLAASGDEPDESSHYLGELEALEPDVVAALADEARARRDAAAAGPAGAPERGGE